MTKPKKKTVTVWLCAYQTEEGWGVAASGTKAKAVAFRKEMAGLGLSEVGPITRVEVRRGARPPRRRCAA